jgi:hypothetical protein
VEEVRLAQVARRLLLEMRPANAHTAMETERRSVGESGSLRKATLDLETDGSTGECWSHRTGSLMIVLGWQGM